MSRGLVRQLLRQRIEAFAGSHKLPYKGGNGELKTPAVYEQFVPVDNDHEPDAPSITVKVDTVTQSDDGRLAKVTLIALVYADDSEQGYRDAENLIEALEVELIANPWLDEGSFKLVGAWETDISDNHMPTFWAVLRCNAEMPALDMVVGPTSDSIGDYT